MQKNPIRCFVSCPSRIKLSEQSEIIELDVSITNISNMDLDRFTIEPRPVEKITWTSKTCQICSGMKGNETKYNEMQMRKRTR